MRSLLMAVILFLCTSAFALQRVSDFAERNNKTICVQAFLDKTPINSGAYIPKNSKGIITVFKNDKTKVLFNITLKSNIGKKGEPPIYLRFIKQKQLNISELLEYASDGDEIFIEEFVPTIDKVNLSCSPASLTVVESL
ncbi:MAG: hypothetical protein R2739_04180 [Chitinophagales bacterium]